MLYLDIIIPVYNEKNTIQEVIQKVLQTQLPNGLDKKIILIDDGSTDGTQELLRSVNSEKIKIIFHNQNKGKGAAVTTGLKASDGKYALIQDADLEYDPNEYVKLLAPLLENKADVVYGSRFLGNDPHRTLYYRHYIGNKFLTFFSNLFTNLNLSDMETCYKVFDHKVVEEIKNKLESQRFNIEPEITARIKKYRVYEVGISYHGRTYEEGKKISWKDGFSALWAIIKFNILR